MHLIILYCLPMCYWCVPFATKSVSATFFFKFYDLSARPRSPDGNSTPKPEVPVPAPKIMRICSPWYGLWQTLPLAKTAIFSTILWRTDALLINFESWNWEFLIFCSAYRQTCSTQFNKKEDSCVSSCLF